MENKLTQLDKVSLDAVRCIIDMLLDCDDEGVNGFADQWERERPDLTIAEYIAVSANKIAKEAITMAN
jgi:hypothetical protein